MEKLGAEKLNLILGVSVKMWGALMANPENCVVFNNLVMLF